MFSALKLRESADTSGAGGYTDGVATRSRSAEDDDDDDQEVIYEVERIHNKRVIFKAGKGQLQYKVRWRGFGRQVTTRAVPTTRDSRGRFSDERGRQADTWEPLENLEAALTLVSDYEASIWTDPFHSPTPSAAGSSAR